MKTFAEILSEGNKEIRDFAERVGYNTCLIEILDYLNDNFDILITKSPLAIVNDISNKCKTLIKHK